MEKSRYQQVLEAMRVATPLGILILGFYLNGVRDDIKEMRAEVFHHMTNDEIHSPRSVCVLKPEFDIYQKMRDIQMLELRDELRQIRTLLQKR